MPCELAVAVKAARVAGRLLRDGFGSDHQVFHKGPANLVTEMDQRAEETISNILKEEFPAYGLISEETGKRSTRSDHVWLVDPLDGTTNYAHGYPFFAISIGLQRDGKTILGVVYNPILNELFVAEHGKGATLNERPIRVSTTACLNDSLLASGFPYDAWLNEDDNGRQWRSFLKLALSLRSDGSAALDLCHVAMGRLDGYWELDLDPWDMAAGALIVQEAGGQVTHTDASRFSAHGRCVLASNGQLHPAMLARMQ